MTEFWIWADAVDDAAGDLKAMLNVGWKEFWIAYSARSLIYDRNPFF